MRRPALALVAATAALGLAATPALAGIPAMYSTSGGDPYYPWAGSGGYDAKHYFLDLKYDTATKAMDATAQIRLKALSDLDKIAFDIRGLTVTSVKIGSRVLAFTQETNTYPDTVPGESVTREELIVTMDTPLREGQMTEFTIDYEGTMGQPLDVEGSPYGWVAFADGAFVANEPEGAATWYPVNDNPADKATYEFNVTVPQGKTAVANGELISKRTREGWTSWRWRSDDVIASYLTTASVGDYDLTYDQSGSGVPIINAVDRDFSAAQKATAAARLALQPAMIDFFETKFGPYPFGSFGAIFDDNSVGYALETQSRPIYSGVGSEGTIAHELAHQWFGDAITPDKWTDIWLNEGWGTYAPILWTEHRGGRTAQAWFDATYATAPTSSLWRKPAGNPGNDDLFNTAVYTRGGLTLHALRVKMGDETFFNFVRAWTAQKKQQNYTTADFQAMAEEFSGLDLDNFFHVWLYTTGKPAPGSWD
jgi:aminopeptidase N